MTDNTSSARQRHQDSYVVCKPESIDYRGLQQLLTEHPELRVVDEYDGLLEELFRIENPSARPDNTEYYANFGDFCKKHYGTNAKHDAGRWFYYPWRGAIVHTLPVELHNLVRTNRNRDIISEEEQQTLRQTTIAVAGLSVGSNILAGLTMMGQYKCVKIADADELSLSNLNRLQSTVTDIGVPKTTLAARAVYERDPEAAITIFADGLHEGNLDEFLSSVDMVFDEIDDVGMKARLRLAAKERKIPVIMMTDSGDGGILDVERYDLDPNQALFHGRLSAAEVDMLLKERPDHDMWLQLVAKIIGLEHLPSRLIESFPKIGHKLAGAPQLGSAAMISGGIGAYVARMIATKEPIKTGKIPLVIEANILKNYDSELAKRKELLRRFSAQKDTESL